jgi:energy-coupling factor transport system ATP-binding protein
MADVVLEVSAGSLKEVKAKPVPLNSKAITGTVTVLIGDNGSGKTTYLRKLAEVSGVLVPQPASDLLFHDSVASELQQADLDANVPAGTTAAILKNFALNLDESQNPRDLSEGQKLLLALSIQLAKQEDLLMLDEPTLGLDTASRQHLVDIVSDLANRGVKILIATHDREFADAIGTEILEVEGVRQ